MLSLYEILKASKTGIAPDMWTALAGMNWGGADSGHEVKELTGIPPLSFTADGTPLLDYLISGNTVQNGIPTPTNPVDVNGVGTLDSGQYKIPISSGGENLLDLSKYTGYSTGISDIIIDENSITYTATSSLLAIRYSFPLTENDSYVVSLGKESTSRLELRYFKDDAQVGNAIVVTSGNNARITGGTQYDSIRIYISNGNSTGVIVASNIMLNHGSTPLPYSPYNRTTTTIYLGEVPTTRKIKKLVLTGDENWVSKGNPATFRYENSPIPYTLNNSVCYCSHFKNLPWQQVIITNNSFAVEFTSNPDTINIRCDDYSTVDDFKAFLAAQYASGNPVTIWYVLATPTTGIVNEPLMKIGDYADTVSMEQAGVSIPTLNGQTVVDVETTLKPSQMYIKYQE